MLVFDMSYFNAGFVVERRFSLYISKKTVPQILWIFYYYMFTRYSITEQWWNMDNVKSVSFRFLNQFIISKNVLFSIRPKISNLFIFLWMIITWKTLPISLSTPLHVSRGLVSFYWILLSVSEYVFINFSLLLFNLGNFLVQQVILEARYRKRRRLEKLFLIWLRLTYEVLLNIFERLYCLS